MKEISALAGPQDLQAVLDCRLEESGRERGGSIEAELLGPSYSVHAVEDQEFYVAAHNLDSDGSEYTWLEVTPGIGTFQRMLSFRGDEVHIAKRVAFLWRIGNVEDGGIMPPEDVHDLYLTIGDLSLRPRKEAVNSFYRNRNAGRPAPVRPVFRMLGIDRPPRYFRLPD